jgi:hypothetical protein
MVDNALVQIRPYGPREQIPRDYGGGSYDADDVMTRHDTIQEVFQIRFRSRGAL